MFNIEDIFGNSDPIAVIGLACRFPNAKNAHEFWQNLLAGQEGCSGPFSRDELIAAGIPIETLDAPNYVNRSAVIEGATQFDAALFGYSRQEAELIDPQQRLFLQTAWHALEDAGYPPLSSDNKTAVFGAARISSYPGQEAIKITELAQVNKIQSLLGNDKDYIATRTAYKMGLTGPAITVQTACSSSLVAVHLACESLRAGECNIALAGGAAISFPQLAGYLYQPGMIFSPDGHCRPFDDDAQGTFPGNGVGIVVLRRLQDALDDNDTILAVIRGSAINNDGQHKVGYTAPSVQGQRNVIQDALNMADITPQDIGMIEAHGTGTPLGDPIEFQSLCEAFGHSSNKQYCALGSVKGNIGHTDTAAGIASLIKTVLSVYHGYIPPNLHFKKANQAIKLADSPFYIPTQMTIWSETTRNAGISAFGFGGTNCHMIVSSMPELPQRSLSDTPYANNRALLLSANSLFSLRQLARNYAQVWTNKTASDLAYTALHGRQVDLSHRLAIPLDHQTVTSLTEFAENQPLHSGYYGNNTARQKQVWLFTGQGSQWSGMGKSLFEQSTVFADTLKRCQKILSKLLEEPLLTVMFSDDHPLLQQMEYVQPAIVSYEFALASHWLAQGLQPECVIGHSIGEYTAALVAGYYTPEDLLPLIYWRGKLMQQQASGGAMLAVMIDAEQTEMYAHEYHLDIAAYNNEQRHVLSGAESSIAQLITCLDGKNIPYRRLNVHGAAHSVMMEPILASFAEKMANLPCHTGYFKFISTLTAQTITFTQEQQSDYWCRHLRQPVKYYQAILEALNQGGTLFIEMGADAQLTSLGKPIADNSATWIACVTRPELEPNALLTTTLRLYTAGIDLPYLKQLNPHGRCIPAPLYPFDEQHYWREPVQEVPLLSTIPLKLIEGDKVAREEAQRLELKRLELFYDCTNQLHTIAVNRLLNQCVGSKIDKGLTIAQILRQGKILPRYRQLLQRLLNTGVKQGYLVKKDDLYQRIDEVSSDREVVLLEELTEYCEGHDAIAETIGRASQHLTEMLQGSIDPVEVIFPQGSSSGVEVLYQEFSFGRYFNLIAAGILRDLIRVYQQQGRTLRILEVGGGTGGTTAWLLPVLVQMGTPVEYVFSDITPLFTRRAMQKFAAYPFVRYQELDLQRDLLSQNIEPESFDLVIAANVIHATQNIAQTLQNIRRVLKADGHLLLREITQPMSLFDFVFGPLVLPFHDEELRQGELFLTVEGWERVCRDNNFKQFHWLPGPNTETSTISEHILLASCHDKGIRRTVSVVEPNPISHPILGVCLDTRGVYQANWSMCQNDKARLQEYINQTISNLIQRHGREGASPYLHTFNGDIPADLSHIRIYWSAYRIAEANVLIEVQQQEQWLTLFHGSPYFSSDRIKQFIEPLSAIDSQYYWQWQPCSVVEQDSSFGKYMDTDEPGVMRLSTRLNEMSTSSLLVCIPNLSPVQQAIWLKKILHSHPNEDILFVTLNAWSISGNEMVTPEQRAIWGMIKVIAVEQSQQHIAVIDLVHLDDLTPDMLSQVISGCQMGERWFAWRENKLLTQRLILSNGEASPLPLSTFNRSGWHIITGAFGGLGWFSVQWLLSQGVRYIALLAPRLSEEKFNELKQLEEIYSADLRWVELDCSDNELLTDCLIQLQKERPISGAIHAAGVLKDELITQLSDNTLIETFAVKAEAAATLLSQLRTFHADYLLLFSSAASVLGTSGQSAHAFACGYIDGLAASQKQSCPVTVSINWGAWSEIGLAASKTVQQQLKAGGMATINPREGRWHLEQALMRGNTNYVAMRVEPQLLIQRRLQEQLISTNPLSVTDKIRPSEFIQAPILTGDMRQDIEHLIQWLKALVITQLRIENPEIVTSTQDLLRLGLDSLLFIELSSEINKQFAIRLDVQKAYQDLTLSGLASQIYEQYQQQSALPFITHDAVHRYDAFPLTAIQHAYWLGRTDMIDYGGVACHVLFEWDLLTDNFDVQKLEQAWDKVVKNHDMLRMVVNDEGLQIVLPQTPFYHFVDHDLRHYTMDEQEVALTKLRKDLSERVAKTDKWPLFTIEVSRLSERQFRLHMDLDLLMFDVQSFKIMFDDFMAAYYGNNIISPSITFRDYVITELGERSDKNWQTSWLYWQNILPTLPPAPNLPLATVHDKSAHQVVTRQGRLNKEEWQNLKIQWQSWGVTPSAALLALYAVSLASFCRHPAFTLNLTFFDRRSYHDDVQKIIGDFTSVLLIDVDLKKPVLLRQFIEKTQTLLWQRLAHSQVNGVELLRDWGRLLGLPHTPLMPVVFTSMLGMSLNGLEIDQAMSRFFGDPAYVFTQTPQVLLDHQVMEIDGELIWHWYCMDDVLGPNIAQRCFDAYQTLLHTVASEPEKLAVWSTNNIPIFKDFKLTVNDNDSRLIESVLYQHPAVRMVEASDSIDGCYVVRWVAEDNLPVVPDTPTLTYKILDNETQLLDEVEQCWSYLDDKALMGIVSTLSQYQLFQHVGDCLSLTAIQQQLQVVDSAKIALKQWLNLLCERGWLKLQDHVYTALNAFVHCKTQLIKPHFEWCHILDYYLDTSVQHHTELLTGRCNALSLLFTEDERITQALYRDNPMMFSLHQQALHLAKQLSQGRSDFRILEVGAGTGSTTEYLLPELSDSLAEYRFTDVSPLFLSRAKEQFSHYACFNTGLLDINLPVDFQQHHASGYDLIVATNVLHDANHIVQSLIRLRRLLSPTGKLLLIEATERHSALQAATISFIESLNGYRDFRLFDDKPMLDTNRWHEVLSEAGFTTLIQWPNDQTTLRQHLFIATPTLMARTDPQLLANHLLQISPELAQISIDWQQTEHLLEKPKLQTSLLNQSLPTTEILADQLVIDAVWQCWKTFLGDGITLNSHFFQSGGDSLIATRMVSRLHKMGYRGVSLQKLFENPVLQNFCKGITSPKAELSHLVPLTITSSQHTPLFVFPVSDGDCSVYLPLLKMLNNVPAYGLNYDFMEKGICSLPDLVGHYVRVIRQFRPAGPYHLIGWSYGTFLAAHAATLLSQSGEDVTLILIDPVCRIDFADRPMDDLLVELADNIAETNHTQKLKAERLLSFLSDYSLIQPITEINCLLFEAKYRPVQWHSLDEEWQGWLKEADCCQFDSDHWEWINDAPVCSLIANKINQYLTNKENI